MVHSDAIWNDVLEVVTAEKKQGCILSLFETIFGKLELLRKFWKQGS